MEYRFQLGKFPYLSVAEIITVLKSEGLTYHVLDFSSSELHIEIEHINPEILLQILGGTRSIFSVSDNALFKQKVGDYKKREFGKPRVDPKSGLLPSKLAKMMINLSFSNTGVKTIYDPFCGGGTIITEANVMGIRGIGSDVEGQTVKDARANAAWVQKEYRLHLQNEFFVSDVRDIDVSVMRTKGIDAIVTEPYLGAPLKTAIHMRTADKANMERVNEIISEALKKASGILDSGKRIVIIIPAFKTIKGVKKLEISEKFNRFSFKKVDPFDGLHIDKNPNLLYFRPAAIVLREIYILEKV